MDRKIALDWAKALESGEYAQTKNKLRDSSGFCCLGVLCNLHALAHPDIAAEQTNPYSYIGEDTAPPIEVKLWAGMNSRLGYLVGIVEIKNDAGTASDLATLNDEFDYDFKKIAKLIRKHYAKL